MTGTARQRASALYRGEVIHRRHAAPVHELRANVYSLLLDLDELEDLTRELVLFGYGRHRPFGFRDRDHGPRDGTPLKAWIVEELTRAGLSAERWSVRIHCFPRVLGSVFNPLSTWFAHDETGALRAILYEVSNTFGQRHGYLVPIGPEEGAAHRHTAEKTFHVSPFFDVSGSYAFRTSVPGERLNLMIRYDGPEGPRLTATHTGVRRPLTDAELLKAAAACPHLTFRVLRGIHWHALKLWLKGARYHAPPAPPARLVEVVKGPHALAGPAE